MKHETVLTASDITMCASRATLSMKHDGNDPTFVTALSREVEQAVLAKLEQRQEPVQGWKLVPVECTHDMAKAAWGDVTNWADFAAQWKRAVLASPAAPTTPAQEPLEKLTRLTEEMGLYPWQEPVKGWKLVPVEPNKAALIGEFSFEIEQTCSACNFGEPEDDCEVCGGAVQYMQPVTVPWTTIKKIYAAMLNAAPTTTALLEAAEKALETVEQMLRHFTKTPSTYKDSDHRAKTHEAIHGLRAAIEAHKEFLREEAMARTMVEDDK